MRAEQLLAHFDRIADAPDAVQRLRQFILELAVRGRLVEQDQSDELVVALLERIATERRRRELGRKNGLQPILAKVKPDEGWFEIPKSWQWARLGSITEVVMGTSPPGSTYNKSGEGIPLINGPVEFTEGPFGKTVVNQYTTAPTNLCEAGDFLICVRGSTTGRTNVAAFKACIGRGVAAIRPLYDDQYVRLFIWRLRPHIIAMGRGIAFPSVSRKQIEELPIPLPPLAEQHRIVAKVDELMALCDQLETAQAERESRRDRLAAASLDRLNNGADAGAFREHARFHLRHLPRLATRPEHIKQLRQTILNLAVRGRLVPQDPSDEPAEDCLRRLGLGHAAFVNAFDADDKLLPPSWSRVRFEDVATIAGGVTLGRKLGERKTVTLPYLRVANVQRGAFDLSIIKEVTIAENEIERYSLRENDLLMTEGGDWDKVGRAAVWIGQIPVCIHQNHVFRARMRSGELMPTWFERYFNSPEGRSYFESASKQTTNLASINMRQVRGCPIPFPPLGEQRRILACVAELMGLCDRLEAALVLCQTVSRRLLDAMLHEALAPGR